MVAQHLREPGAWTRVESPGWIRDVVQFGSSFLALGSDDEGRPTLWRSNNAKSWQPVYVHADRDGSMAQLARGAKGTVVIGSLRDGEDSRAAIWYSRGGSGSDMALVETIADTSLHSLVATDDGVVAFGNSNRGEPFVMRSDDGRSWAREDMVFDVAPRAVRDITSWDDRFYAVGDSTGASEFMATVWRSHDGVRWSLEFRSPDPSSAGVVSSITTLPDGVVALSIPTEGPPDAFIWWTFLHIQGRDGSWTSTRLSVVVDETLRLPGVLAYARGRVLLSTSINQGHELLLVEP
jgi:hypothetical protein